MKYLKAARDIFLLVIVLYLSEIIGMMAGAAIYEMVPEGALSHILYILVNTITYLLLVLGSVTLYTKKILHLKLTDFGLRKPNKPFDKTFLFLFMLPFIIIMFTVLIFKGDWYLATREEWGLRLLQAFIDYGIGAGVAEEIIFRGIMWKTVDHHLGKMKGMWISSIIFTLLHIPGAKGAGQLVAIFIYTFVLAILLCGIVFKSGSLLGGILFHGVWNFVFYGCVALETDVSGTALVTYQVENGAYLLVVPIVVCIIANLLIFNESSCKIKRGTI